VPVTTIERKPLTLHRLRAMHAAGVDVLLGGDSLGMVLQGVANRHAWVVADLPFGSCQASSEQSLNSAARLIDNLEIPVG
jgi:3-methyl-2-oxobutanoate hydroxymethyltransferase